MRCVHLYSQCLHFQRFKRTFLTDKEGSYQSRVNVFGCVDVRVVESGQTVAVFRCGGMVFC